MSRGVIGRATCEEFPPVADAREVAARDAPVGRVRAVTIRDWQSETPVRLTYTTPYFGGYRPWFLCPTCSRRCQLLYRRMGELACRICHDLVYRSQLEGREDRLRRRAQDIRFRLGGSTNLLAPFPDRPKGMRRRTYARWRERGLAAEDALLGTMQRRWSQ